MGVLDAKLRDYAAETDYKPFFEALFSKEAIVSASVLQSCYTTFGMSLYEQIAVVLAKSNDWEANRQYSLLGSVDEATETLIHQICNASDAPNKLRDIEFIRKNIKKGPPLKDKESIVDVFVRKADGTEMYVDITTVKGNLKEFRALRRKMLRWCALRFSQNPQVKIQTYIGIPYNPYHPEKYTRWTSVECDPVHDMLVQNDLWNAFAGEEVFEDLLGVFSEVGRVYREHLQKLITGRST
jgi:hypothetical protein